MKTHEENLAELHQRVIEIAGIEVPLGDEGLFVVRCTAESKAALASVVTEAAALKLRAKWLNDGTLVAIGVPTKKPPQKGT